MSWGKFIKDLFSGRGQWQDKCTCGDRKICTTVKYIEGPGVVGLDSNTLVKCGKFHQQVEAAHRFFLRHQQRENNELNQRRKRLD